MTDQLPTNRRFKLTAPKIGGLILFIMVAMCIGTLGQSLNAYDAQDLNETLSKPDGSSFATIFGTDNLGRSLIWRCLLGGAISLGIGMAAAEIR